MIVNLYSTQSLAKKPPSQHKIGFFYTLNFGIKLLFFFFFFFFTVINPLTVAVHTLYNLYTI